MFRLLISIILMFRFVKQLVVNVSTIQHERQRPIAKKKMKTESILKLLIVTVLLVVFVGSVFLIYQYFGKLNSPPRTYADYQLRFWNEVLKSKPNDPGALTNVGFVYLEDDQEKKAEEYFLKALKNDPKYVPALYNLGVYYKKNDNIKKAVDNLVNASKYAEDGNKYLAFFTLGEIYQEQEDFDKAIDSYVKSIEDEDQIWNSHQKLGEIYEKQGEILKALDHYREAIRFNPSNIELQEAIERLEGESI